MALLNHFKILRFCTWNRRIWYITKFSFVWLLIFFIYVVHDDLFVCPFNWFKLHIFYPVNCVKHIQIIIRCIGEISTWFLNTWTMIWRKYCTIVPRPKSRYSNRLTQKVELTVRCVIAALLKMYHWQNSICLGLYGPAAKRIALLPCQ